MSTTLSNWEKTTWTNDYLSDPDVIGNTERNHGDSNAG